MPWRDIIFTETGVIFPPSWNMNALQAERDMLAWTAAWQADISGPMAKSESNIPPCDDISALMTVSAVPSLHVEQRLSSASSVLTEQADAASSANTPKHGQAGPLPVQDHFARRATSAAPSFPRGNEHVALPALPSLPAAAPPYAPQDSTSYGSLGPYVNYVARGRGGASL